MTPDRATSIQLVVFDMAGTTVDDGNAVNDCFRASLAAVGLVVTPESVNAFMGFPKPLAIRKLIERSAMSSELAARVEEIHSDFVRRMREFYGSSPSLRPMPGAEEAFRALRSRGVKVALNTGFNRAIADVILQRFGWDESVVDSTIASDEAPAGRPHPDMIRSLMTRLGVSDPRHVAKVGDTPVDLEEGRNAGCGLVIGVANGTHTRAELAAHQATHIVDSVADVPAIF